MPRLLAALLVAFALPVQAQISITRADIEAGFDRREITHVYDPQSEVAEVAAMPDTTGLAAVLAADGPDQTWDLTTLVEGFAFFDRREAELVPSDPDPADFPAYDHPHFLETGTNVIRRVGVRRDIDESPDSVSVFYGRLDDSGLYLTGSVVGDIDTDMDAVPDTIVTRFHNAGDGPSGALEVPFPVTFGDTFSRMRTDTTELVIAGVPLEVGGLTETVMTTVDGWGTLVTPNGSFPALRARIVQTTDVPPAGPSAGDLDLRIYSFITQGAEAVELMWMESFPEDDPDAVVDGFGWFQADPAAVAAEPEAQPTAARLAASYPNPFRTATTVPFELAAAGSVRLVVYDVLGREVARLADGRYAAGYHEVAFDASGRPAGVYLVRLTADGRTATRKVLLQR